MSRITKICYCKNSMKPEYYQHYSMPFFLEEAPSSYLCSQIIQIIARISYVNPDALMTFLATYHDNLPTSNENARMPESIRKIVSKDQTYDSVVNKLLTGWIVCFRDIFDPKFKKFTY